MKKKPLKIELPEEEKENLKIKLLEESGEELDDAELGLLIAIRKFAESELSGKTNILIGASRTTEEVQAIGKDSDSESEE